MTGAIITIPLIALFLLCSAKLNKQPKILAFKSKGMGNPKQSGQPAGIQSTYKPDVRFKFHAEWIEYIRNERKTLNR